jgi:hypothetical protein
MAAARGFMAGKLARELGPRLRAAVLAYFVVFNVLAALPTVGSASPERLERPREQAELRRWARLFDALGIEVDPARLSDVYLPIADGVARARSFLITPIQWWMDLTLSEQSWRLFAMPHDSPSALKIVARRSGEDELLYMSGDDDHRWGSAMLEYRRVRAAYKPSQAGPPGTYDGFALRVSERIFDEMPEVDRVTVSLVRRHTTLPGAVPDPELEETAVATFERREQ